MKIIHLMLGSNVGDRLKYLHRSIDMLNIEAGRVTAISSIYESEPWGFNDAQWFLNQAIAIETELTPINLLKNIQRIEQTLGRQCSNNGYQSRTIDIDILLYGNLIINFPELVIPHLRMTERMFVMQPMAELSPEMKHPALDCTMSYLREHCSDTKKVALYKPV